MAKDPAFLFYSKDFYEGTRMMLPEERACYMDLLMYQHQNGGFIPNEPKRLLLYCSGIDEATLIDTLKAKFTLSDKGWYNQKLQNIVSSREVFTSKQSINGRVGQFWKKAKAMLDDQSLVQLRAEMQGFTNEEIFKKIENIDLSDKEKMQAMLKALLKHLAIANAIVIDKGKEGSGEKPISKNKAYLSELLISEMWLESVCRQGKIPESKAKEKLNEFFLLLEAQQDQKVNKKEFTTHFVYWLNNDLKKNTENGQRNFTQPYRNV